ncbi:hypothetical protein FNX44_000060 [Streptomyces sp. OF1]|uniref:Uncharacterized protein n=1 Tax=Streptomyces alkaliterrae TaxID=2213162 RepID=A0A5P0YIY8_9ACTN|nr:hypothetical protein [Streptomyces alkaliterrae]
MPDVEPVRHHVDPERVAFDALPSADFGPCECPDPACSLKQPPNVQRDRSDSALADLRARIARDIAARRRFGTLGRLL